MSIDGSCLEWLRAGTRDAHARMEAVPALERVLATNLTRSEYSAILRHMLAFHAATEPAIAAALAAYPQAAALLDDARPHALRADLAWLDVAQPPQHFPAPVFAGPASALGALYVVEGSALGARVIARRIASSVGAVRGRGGSYYGGQTAEAARLRWQLVCGLLDAPWLAEDRGRALVEGAVQTFRQLEGWMRQIEVAGGAGNACGRGHGQLQGAAA